MAQIALVNVRAHYCIFANRAKTFVFHSIDSPPVVSLLRHFSAPVKLHHKVCDETLAFLMSKDTDFFNRWDAGQRLAIRAILSMLKEPNNTSRGLQLLTRSWGALLEDESIDLAFKSAVISLPSIAMLTGELSDIDYQALALAHGKMACALAEKYQDTLVNYVANLRNFGPYTLDHDSMSRRSLANTALALLSYLPGDNWEELAFNQYNRASNMTDKVAALSVLCHSNTDSREHCLRDFREKAENNRLVMDKWFSVQALARRSSVLNDVVKLTHDIEFEPSNPNRVHSLVGSFVMNNTAGFHSVDGGGYRFLANQVLALDQSNPQLAARLVSPLSHYKRAALTAQALMKRELVRIMDSGPLSPDVYEMVSKSLK